MRGHHDINQRAIYHSIETGTGYEGLVTFCSIMNMPCLAKSAYHVQVENILCALEAEVDCQATKKNKKRRQRSGTPSDKERGSTV